MADRIAEFNVTHPCELMTFLLENVKGKSRNNIKSLLTHRQVSVDGMPISRFDHPLREGQWVSVTLYTQAPVRSLPFPILFEDDELIAIDKPAGLLSIASDKEREKTAYRMVTDYVKELDPANRIFIIHRLDKDTSGVLVFVKNEELKLSMQDNWDSLVKVRSYLALVEGAPESEEGTIRSWLQESSTHMVYSGNGTDGKLAVTHYKLIKKTGNLSLLDVRLDTGRKNQIRVHMKDLGCPVVGDKKYGAATNPINRMGLHACELTLRHPCTGAELSFTADTPKELRSFI